MVYEVICKECEKKIDVNIDKHTLIGTYNGDRVEDESYFHFECFVKWYNHKVSEKAKNTTNMMQSKVQGLMKDPKIAGLLSMVGGVDKLKGMLNTDLGSNNKNVNEEMDVQGMINSFMESGVKKSSVEKVNNNGNTKKRKPRAKPTKKKVQ